MVEKYAFCFFFLTVTSAVGIGFLALDCVIIMVTILEEGSVVGFEFYYLFIYLFSLYSTQFCSLYHEIMLGFALIGFFNAKRF
jgi:hypothetical protein